jgi:hypothetical protein
MKLRVIGIYSIFIGMSVIGLWLMILNNQVLPEGRTELAFHLFSEFFMATICIAGGILLLRKNRVGKPFTIIGLSMVIYSVLNAAGYYAEKHEIPMAVMFIVLFLVTASALFLMLKPEKGSVN